MSVESYAHKAAKAVVLGWFRSVAAARVDVCDCIGVTWRVNREGPHFGIWEEYPILANGIGIEPVWDEAGWFDDRFRDFDDAPPTYERLRAMDCAPACILDIAVQHKGAVICGIEIVHKHAPDQWKLDLLQRLRLESLIVLPAQWVLAQVAMPLQPAPLEFWHRGAPSDGKLTAASCIFAEAARYGWRGDQMKTNGAAT